jgi:hypothetical protein
MPCRELHPSVLGVGVCASSFFFCHIFHPLGPMAETELVGKVGVPNASVLRVGLFAVCIWCQQLLMFRLRPDS